MSTKQGRQADILAANESDGGRVSASIMPRPPALDLATIDRGEFDVFTDGYSSGYAAGLARGRAEAEAEMQAHWSALAARIRRIPDWPTQAELAERRAS
jgi:hypothetical protein